MFGCTICMFSGCFGNLEAILSILFSSGHDEGIPWISSKYSNFDDLAL